MNTLIETLHHDIYKSFVLAHPNSKTKLLAKLWDLHSEQEYGDRNKGEWLNTMYPSFTELFVDYCKAHKINFKDFIKLYKFNEKNKEEIIKFITLKKAKSITIFRAEFSTELGHSNNINFGHSWTLNKNVAKFFANRWNNPYILKSLNLNNKKNCYVEVVEATITGDDNFYYCNDREEEEVFLIDPNVAKIHGGCLAWFMDTIDGSPKIFQEEKFNKY